MTTKLKQLALDMVESFTLCQKLAYIQEHVNPDIVVKQKKIVQLTKDMKVFKKTVSSRSAHVIVNMIIPAGSFIHVGSTYGDTPYSIYSLKCRASKAKVISQFASPSPYRRMTKIPVEVKESRPKTYCNANTVYCTGDTIVPDKFSRQLHECANGIHFFVTLKEAYDYV